jgi:hypothetical protein
MPNRRTPAISPRSRGRSSALLAALIAAAALPMAFDDLGPAAPVSAASPGLVETFDTPASLDRFDFAVHHAWTANDTDETWVGDHDTSCGAPEPGRTVRNPTRVDDGKTYYPGMRNPVAYWCRVHMMTTFNTNHYAQVDFAPKQTFEGVARVCWDQNRTDLGSRTWTQVVVVPLDTFDANRGRFDYVASRFSPDGPGKYGIHPTDETLMVEFGQGAPRVQVGQAVDDSAGHGWNAGSDKATRYQICFENAGSNQLRVTQGRAGGGADVYTLRGQIPTGDVKVIFQHDLYNPDKAPGVDNGYTWHWDNIIVETSDWRAPAAPVATGGNDDFQSLRPQRAFDSRSGAGQLRAGSVTPIGVAGKYGVPAGAKAVVVNVTAVNSADGGHLVVGACGERPATSTVNFGPREARANQATVPLDAQGRLCVWPAATTDVLIDVTGYYPSSSRYEPIAGLRYLDTRSSSGAFDRSTAVGRVPAGRQIEVQVAGRGPVPSSAAAVSINLTAAAPSDGGYALAFPCGTPVPNASNLNFSAGRTTASGGLVSVGVGGKVCIYTSAATDLLLDVDGWLPSSGFQPLVPARLADTRPRHATVDGKVAGVGPVAGGTMLRVPVRGRGGVPQSAAAVAVHVTVANAQGDGYASVFPCAHQSSDASTVNYRAGQTTTNGAIVGADGDMCVYTRATANIIVDVEGIFPG